MSEAQAIVAGNSIMKPETKRFLYLLICIAAGVITYLLPITPVETGRRALSITVFVIAMFIAEPVPLGVTGLLGCWLYWVWAGIPAAKAFSGFHSSTPWFILGVLLMGIMAESTGLAKRIAYNMVCRLGSNYSSILAGMMVLNLLLTFIIPSGLAKTLVLCTIAIGLIQSYGLSKESNIGRGLMLAMTYQSGLFDKVILAGAATILSKGAHRISRQGTRLLWSVAGGLSAHHPAHDPCELVDHTKTLPARKEDSRGRSGVLPERAEKDGSACPQEKSKQRSSCQ